MNEIVEWVEDDERWEQENTWWMGNVGPAHLQLQSDVGHNNDPNNLNKSKCAPTPWYYYASKVLILRNVWKQQREEKARQAKAKLVSQKNGAWRPLGGDIDGGGSASAPKLAHASAHTNQYTHAPTIISQSSSTGPFFIHPPLLISHLFSSPDQPPFLSFSFSFLTSSICQDWFCCFLSSFTNVYVCRVSV